MREFSLFLDVKGDWILVSTSAEFQNPFSPYDESLSEKEHSQYNLSFSIATKSVVDGVWNMNPLLSYYFLGARMYLILDNKKRVDLIISKVAPDSNELASILSIEAQDEVSYKWSKRNLGMNYSTQVKDVTVPKNIFDIAKEVLELSFLDNEWAISSQSLDPELETQPFTLEVADSNPYNILIEACNTINAYMDVDYNKKRLDFFRKDLVKEFSGYRYTPSVNASDYSVDYNGEEMTTVLHVSGGEDAKGNLVTMIPSMPEAVRKWFKIAGFSNSSFNWEEARENISNNSFYKKFKVTKDGNTQEYIKLMTDLKLDYNGLQLTSAPYINMTIQLDEERVFKIEKNLSDKITIDGVEQEQDGYYRINKSGVIYLLPLNILVFDNPLSFRIELDENIRLKNSFNNAFVSVAFYRIGDQYEEPSIYYVKYNDLKGIYQGHIEYINTSTTEEYNFDIYADSEYPFGSAGSDEDISNKSYKKYEVTTDEGNIIYIYQSNDDIEMARKELEEQQDKEINQFFTIVEKIPYLGQSIFDFSPFYCYMSKNERDTLNDLINIEMRNTNIKIQYYTEEYYNTAYELNLLRKKFVSYAELYGAACNKYQDAIKSAEGEGEVTNSTELINEINKTAQDLNSVIISSKYFDLIDLLGQSEELNTISYTEYFENLITQQKQSIEEYQKYKIGIVSDSNAPDRQGEIEYYTNLIKTANQLCYGFDYSGVENRGVYQLIVDYIKDIKDGSTPPPTGIAYYLQEAQNDLNNRILQQLYYKFNLYIYEQNYENSDELDSVALYNQAITHFADINRPQSNHSLEVLDIGELEQINIPRLSIGSMIQVYNRDSINAQPYLYILRQIEKYFALEQNAHISNLSKKSEYASNRDKFEIKLKEVYKENNNIGDGTDISLNEIYNKIYYDSIFVTGITRVLREPLKDSVTVEQPSRYKTILSKLIKSI